MNLREFQGIKMLGRYVRHINDLIGEGKNLEQIVRIISRKAGFRVSKEIIRRVYRNVTFASLDNEIKAAEGITFDLLEEYKRKYRAQKDEALRVKDSWSNDGRSYSKGDADDKVYRVLR